MCRICPAPSLELSQPRFDALPPRETPPRNCTETVPHLPGQKLDLSQNLDASTPTRPGVLHALQTVRKSVKKLAKDTTVLSNTTAWPNLAGAAPAQAQLYCKKKPNQLQRVQITGPAAAQPANTVRKSRSRVTTNGSIKELPGPLVQRGKHSLVRRGGLLKAVARTVAAAKAPKHSKAPNTWNRSSQYGEAWQRLSSLANQLGMLPRPQQQYRRHAFGPPPATSAPKKTFKWSKDVPFSSSNRLVSSSSKLLGQPQYKARKAKSAQAPSGYSRRLQPGKAKPAKLVRMGGTLYKVSGTGKGKSLKRQTAPVTVRKPSPLSQVSCVALEIYSLHLLHINNADSS